MSKARVLIIAGSDSGGGAGIQADIKATEMTGAYAATAITALTAQNTLGVHGVMGIDPDFIAQQMRVVLDDIGADAIKTGMLHSREVIAKVAQTLQAYRDIPLVVDPVMRAKGGAALIAPDAQQVLIEALLPLATVLTPNIPEAEALTGLPIKDKAGMIRAGHSLLTMGPGAVLMKGGHLDTEQMVDILLDEEGRITELPSGPRLATKHTHGTGCTLASALASGLARGFPLVDACKGAVSYVRKAIESAPGLGQGYGPLNHAHVL